MVVTDIGLSDHFCASYEMSIITATQIQTDVILKKNIYFLIISNHQQNVKQRTGFIHHC